MLQSMGSQRARQDLASEQHQKKKKIRYFLAREVFYNLK